MDYSKLLPLEPPKGLIEWTIKQVKPMGALVYRAWEEYEPITEQKWKGVRVTCTSCDTTFTAERVDTGGCRGKTSFGFLLPEGIVGDGSKAICPYCGGQVNVLHCSSISKYGTQNMWRTVCSLHRIGDKLALVSWIIVQTIYKDGKSCEAYTDTGFYRYEAYVMEDRKLVRLAGYDKIYNQLHFNDSWEQRKRFVPVLENTELIYPPTYGAMDGTNGENCKLDLYMEAPCGEHWPLEYLNCYVKHKNVENIVSAGYGALLGSMLSKTVTYGGYYGQSKHVDHKLMKIDWKKKRPHEMLGLTKEEARRAKEEAWTADVLYAYRIFKLFRQNRIEATADELRRVYLQFSERDIKRLFEWGVDPVKAVKYIDRQCRTAQYLMDYYGMLDAVTPETAFPRDLTDAHDRLVRAKRIKEDKKKSERFRELAGEYAALEWTDGELCIVIPKSMQELIDEGATLHHCVGGYADQHLNGKMIFFVRHYRRPERSYYTLNVDINATPEPREVQLHGYRNDEKCPIPAKVRAFVDRWEEEILRLYMMENKKKEKKAA